MSLVLTHEILNLLFTKHNVELNKIINSIDNLDHIININLIENINNTEDLFNNKKFKINNQTRCLAKNSQNNQCKRNRVLETNYCKKHLITNKGDYNENYTNIKSNIIIECEYITIEDIKYIYNKNNNLLFSNNLYNPICIGIYINNIIYKYNTHII